MFPAAHGVVSQGLITTDGGGGVQLVGAASAQANTVAIPAHMAGDRIYGWFVDRSSQPGLPSGWTEIYQFNGSNRRGRLAYIVAAAPGTTNPISANASISQVVVYRGVSSQTVKESANDSNSYPNFTFSPQALAGASSRLLLVAMQAATGYPVLAGIFDNTAATPRAHDEIATGLTMSAAIGDTAAAATFAGISKSSAGGAYAKVALELNA